jgi:uncharacterized damage-inducible protein DinB
MNEREFFTERRKAESGLFQRVLEALPKDQFDYRPHERSQSARELVWTLAGETRACCDLIDTGRIDWRHQPPSGDATQLLSAFQRGYTDLSERAAALDDKGWQRKVQFLVEGKMMQEPLLGQFLWYLFFDAIHHRGQLSTYIRPMGGKVPSIYGPSGDDPGQ